MPCSWSFCGVLCTCVPAVSTLFECRSSFFIYTRGKLRVLLCYMCCVSVVRVRHCVVCVCVLLVLFARTCVSVSSSVILTVLTIPLSFSTQLNDEKYESASSNISYTLIMVLSSSPLILHAPLYINMNGLYWSRW